MKGLVSLMALALGAGLAHAAPDDPDARAAKTVGAMSPQERQQLTHGPMALSVFGFQPPAEAVPGAGFIPGLPQHGVPNLTETDARDRKSVV